MAPGLRAVRVSKGTRTPVGGRPANLPAPAPADITHPARCYATLAMSIYREHGHGGAVPPASDRIVSINLVRTAAMSPRLVGHRYGR